MKTIYLKLTNRCNLCCKHCYNANASTIEDMSDVTLNASIKLIEKMSSIEDILVVFHGGEPLIVPSEKYLLIIEQFKENPNVKFSITTNLVYKLTSKHIELFCKFTDIDGFSISTSWDHGIRFSNEQECVWKENVRSLLHNGINVKPIVTITRQLILHYKDANLLFNELKALGIYVINFERLTQNGRALENDLKPANREIDSWLYLAYIASKQSNIKVVLFDTLEEAVRNKNYIGCRKRQCVKDVVTINPDGTISGCPNTYDIVFGTVFGEVNTSNIACELHKEHIKNCNCYVCKFFEYCNGECYLLQFDSTGCPGMIKILEHITSVYL